MCIVNSLLLIECKIRAWRSYKKNPIAVASNHRPLQIWLPCFECLCLCVCLALPLHAHVHIYVPSSALHIYVSFYASVGVWMSVCMSLCCHICCYQGNPVGRRRSAERCTAWRRETCGAQPVAGKKPVRDSPTNPAPFPRP